MTYSSDYINMSNTNNTGNTLLKRQMTKKNGVKEISERQRIIL